MFFVLHGALKLPAQFLPKIPPRMVKGKPTESEKKSKQTKKSQSNAWKIENRHLKTFS